jgi:release factor glutamine methyltransferase
VTDAPFDEAVRRLAEAGIENPRREARLLLAHALGVEVDELLSNPLRHADASHRRANSPVNGGGMEAFASDAGFPPPFTGEVRPKGGEGGTAEAPALFQSLVSRRAAHEPFAYIVGHKEFWSLSFDVGPGALVPRPETETLIEQAMVEFPDRAAPLSVLDLGTGTGCLLLTFLHEYGNAHGTGIDSSPEALSWASRNVAKHRLEARGLLVEGNWDTAGQARYDVILSNPPYITSADIESLAPEVARFEPWAALDGGPDGLDAYRAQAPLLAGWLKPDGRAFLEIGAGQKDAVTAIFEAAGLRIARVAPDLAGIPRCLIVSL